ncbi:head GIN domain-containing protein [Fulvivirgaceae bacterium BMA12]|uniref:Head GIN domain-containing protein n=1 Tax=Agaribacillus aureus TaxID=3051825 RepID=A0ABT8LFF3_9BACT|nr:head GIN domain-containing protein [Fulvivirgaceae bacterium BMA12]
MLKSSIFLLLLTGTVWLTSCSNFRFEKGNGDIIKQNIDVSDFSEINVSGFYEVTLTPGASEEVIIETDENLFDFIEVYVRQNRLVISSKESLKSDFGIKVNVIYNNLESISSSGASIIKTDGTLKAPDVEIAMSGAGLIEMDVECKVLSLNLSGAGMIKLSGRTHKQFLDLSGAGSVDAYAFRSDECSVGVSGVGAAKVYVNDRLNATVSGIGGIQYRGNPSEVHQDVSGVGKVKKDEKYNEPVI